MKIFHGYFEKKVISVENNSVGYTVLKLSG